MVLEGFVCKTYSFLRVLPSKIKDSRALTVIRGRAEKEEDEEEEGGGWNNYIIYSAESRSGMDQAWMVQNPAPNYRLSQRRVQQDLVDIHVRRLHKYTEYA